jgi:hypothetical protein
MITFLLTFLFFLPKTLLGFFLVNWLWPESRLYSIFIKLFSGFAVGLGISSSFMLFAFWLGITPRDYSRIELIVGIFLLILFTWLTSQTLLKKLSDIFLIAKKFFKNKDNFIFIFLLIASLLSLGAFVYYSFKHDHGFSDAWTIWNNLARYIFRSNDPGLIFDTSKYYRLHFDYPAMYSLNIAWVWSLLNKDSTYVPVAFALLSTFALPSVLWASVSQVKGRFQGVLVTIVALMTTSLYLTVAQYSDSLLSLYFLLVGIFLYHYQFTSNPRLLILAGILAGFSAWVKNEGLLFVVVSGLISFYLAILKPKKWWHLLGFILGFAIPLWVVFFFKANVSYQSDLARTPQEIFLQLIDISRYQQILFSYWINIRVFGHWPISAAFVLLIYGILARFSLADAKNSVILLALIVLQQLGYFLIYIITPHDLQLHLDTSLSRLLLQTYPLFLFWLFVTLRSADRVEGDYASRD